jgi:hypothetical protein
VSDFERAYLLKRGGDIGQALEIFNGLDSEEAVIQTCFIHIAQKDATSLQRTISVLPDSSMRSYFEAVVHLERNDAKKAANALVESLERDPRNVHSLLAGLSSHREPQFAWTLEQETVWENPVLLHAAAKGLLSLGKHEESLLAASLAASSWILQADLYLTLLAAARESNSHNVVAAVTSLAHEFGVSEARAAVGLMQLATDEHSTTSLYDARHVHIVRDSRLRTLGAAIVEEVGDNLIHDGDASNFNGRYFSRDVSNLPSFRDYESVLSELLGSVSPDAQEEFNFTWADVSITTNSSNILNHLHTAGRGREYLMTSVTYPEVPSEIVEGRPGGALRVGPARIPGFSVDTWELTQTPSPDIAIFFPSHFFHETVPLLGQQTRRVSINTDFGRRGTHVDQAVASLSSG